MSRNRVLVGAIVTFVALVILTVDHFHTNGLLSAAALSLIAFTATWELCVVLEASGIPTYARITAFVALVMAIVPAVFTRLELETSTFSAQSGIIFGYMVFAFIVAMIRNEPEVGTKAVMGGTFALVYVGLALSFLVRLRDIPDIGEQCVFLVLACAKVGDMGAYFVGRKFGKHPMAPRLSPKKTMEGAIASTILSLIFAAIIWLWAREHVSLLGFMLWAVILSMAAQFGDLAESLVKRAGEVKDSSVVFGKIGGILDVVDSLLLSAPVAYILALLGGFGAG